jgi:hypothetical protein
VKISVPGIRKYKLPVCGFLKLKSEHQWIWLLKSFKSHLIPTHWSSRLCAFCWQYNNK